MNSRIIEGDLFHARLSPVRHAFRYRVFMTLFDLDELEELGAKVGPFGYNRRRLISLFDRDYFSGVGSVKEKVSAQLKARGVEQSVAKVLLVTTPRFLGYSFNPVSFFFCFNEMGDVYAIVVEVNNTFQERHVYVLQESGKRRLGSAIRRNDDKRFHVSPFFDVRGQYRFQFADPREKIDIRIHLVQDDKPVLLTRLTGTIHDFSTGNLIRSLALSPMRIWKTMPRILWQAAKLHYQKGLRVFTKPAPTSPFTHSTKTPTFRQRIAMRVLLNFLKQIRFGSLTVVLPNGDSHRFGDPASDVCATIHMKSYAVFPKLLRSGDVAFGEAHTQGEWECEDLPKLIRIFIENQESLNDSKLGSTWLGRLKNYIGHRLRGNSRAGSKRNIRDHYDLGNDFFRLFLDNSMTYSSAVFQSWDDTLEQAQRNKRSMILEKLRLRPEHHLLEIGSGWGQFAIDAVRTSGCRVTGITLSEQQLEMATARVREAGLQDRIEIRLIDYRDLTGTYDRIVAIEMLEAVGHEHFESFFRSCDRLLAPSGLVVLQFISIPDQRYSYYVRSCDWIRKYIFPGGHLPSLTALCHSMTNASAFVVEHMENIGVHYAKTLQLWRERFVGAKDELLKLGFDERFARMWEYYFCYCEAGFATRTLGNLQLVLTRPNNRSLPNVE